MVEIHTSNGFTIVVSPEDFEWASQYTWYANRVSKRSQTRYAMRSETRKTGHNSFYMHREIMQRTGVDVAGKRLDHINQNGLDNRRENLRVCSQSQNLANSYRRPKEGRPALKGIYRVRKSKINPWAAHITVNYRSIHLGLFPTPEAAARRYDEEAVRLFGEHAALNFPLHT